MRSIPICLALALGAGLFPAASGSFAQAPPPAAAAPGNAAPTNAPAPMIRFVSTTHDFGSVMAGELVRPEFVLTNVGNATLEITEVRPSCGCTTAGNWPRHLDPGRTGAIPIQVNTANLSGPVLKTVTILSNDPRQPAVTLQIKGTVLRPIEVTPGLVIFNLTSDTQTNQSRTVKIFNRSREPLHLSPPQTSFPDFRGVLTTNTPGQVYELTVTAAPPFRVGTSRGVISMRTSSTVMPLVLVNAIAVVQPAPVPFPAPVPPAQGVDSAPPPKP